MKVREAIAALEKLNVNDGDLELMDEYADNLITGFYVSEYDEPDGSHRYVACITETDS